MARPVPQRLLSGLKSAAAFAGLEVHRSDHAHPARRAAAMRVRQIDTVLDVGANRGQYVSWLRAGGFHGRIISFEPQPSAFAALQQCHAGDAKWRGLPLALGEKSATLKMHSMVNSDVLSSFLAPSDDLRRLIPAAGRTEMVDVEVETLDRIWPEVVEPGSKVMLKIDVQGFEHQVLDGALDALHEIVLLEVEMGLIPTYDGGSTIHDLLPRARAAGFSVISIDPGFVDTESGQVLDIDVLLGRPLSAS